MRPERSGHWEKKDTLLFGVSAGVSSQAFVNLEVDGHRYASRGGGFSG